MAKLDSLVVDLRVETAELRKGLDDANKKLDEFDKSLKDLAGVVEFQELGKMALEAGEMLADFALRGAEAADQMGKMAQSAGVSVEELSQLSFAAKLSGVGTDELGIAFSKLNQAIAKAGAGLPQQAALFQALGVAVKDAGGNVRSVDQVLGDLSDRFANMENGASKTALAVDIFGKSGAKLIPFLNQGKDGLAELSAEADRLGITLSGKAVAAATAFNENIIKMHAALDAVALKVAGNVAPALEQLTNEFLKSKNGAQGLKDFTDVLTTALNVLSSVAVGVVAVFNVVGTAIGGLASQLVHLAKGDFSGAAEDADSEAKAIGDSFTAMGQRLSAIWGDTTKMVTDELGKQSGAAKVSADQVLANYKAMEAGAAAYAEALKKVTALVDEWETKAKNATGEVDPITAFANELETGKLSIELNKLGDEADAMRDRLIAAFTAVHDAALKKLSIEMQVKIDAAAFAGYQKASGLAAQYDQIGNNMSPEEQALQAAQATGFKDFTDALSELSRQTELQARKLAEVEELKFEHDTEGAENAQRAAENSKNAADAAGAAANKWLIVAQKAEQELNASIDKINRAISGVMSTISSKLGELGTVIQGVVQGFQTGGIYGAIAAFIIELFSRFQRFSEIVTKATNQLEGAVSQLTPFFNKLTDGFLKFQSALGMITNIVDQAVTPIITTIGKSLSFFGQALVPLLNGISAGLRPLIGILESFEHLAESITPFQEAVKVLAVVFNAVSLTILGIEDGILNAVDKLVIGVHDIAEALGLQDLAATLANFEDGIHNQIDAVEAQLSHIVNNIADPNATGATGDLNGSGGTPVGTSVDPQVTAKNVTTLGDAAKETAASLMKINQQLTNIPATFKYALRAYEATQAGADPFGASAGKPQNGGKGDGPTVNVDVTVNGGVMTTIQDLASAIAKEVGLAVFNRTGAPALSLNSQKRILFK